MKKFIIRTISAVVFAGLIFLSFFLGKTYSFALFGIFMLWVLSEAGKFAPFKSTFRLVMYLLAGAAFYFVAVYGAAAYTMRQLGAMILLFVVSAFAVINIKRSSFPPFFIRAVLFFYITIPFVLFMSLFNFTAITIEGKSFPDFFYPTVFLSVIWIGDCFAYIIGSITGGKHKMAPVISPSKSWEGFIGGFVMVVASVLIFRYFIHIESYLFWMLFVIIAYLFGTCGDLLESSLKRHVSIKDSGKFLPGHGGAFDRFDSFILAIPFIILLLLSFLS